MQVARRAAQVRGIEREATSDWDDPPPELAAAPVSRTEPRTSRRPPAACPARRRARSRPAKPSPAGDRSAARSNTSAARTDRSGAPPGDGARSHGIPPNQGAAQRARDGRGQRATRPDPEDRPPGRYDAGRWRSSARASAKRAGWLRCPAQVPGSVACAGVIQVPVTLDTQGISGVLSATFRTSTANAAGSTCGCSATSRSASSSGSTPARQAATHSPTPWPSRAWGRTPSSSRAAPGHNQPRTAPARPPWRLLCGAATRRTAPSPRGRPARSRTAPPRHPTMAPPPRTGRPPAGRAGPRRRSRSARWRDRVTPARRPPPGGRGRPPRGDGGRPYGLYVAYRPHPAVPHRSLRAANPGVSAWSSSRVSSLRADSTRSCQGREGAGGSAAGASSRITWALVPPTPKELTPARRGSFPVFPGSRSVRVDEERAVRRSRWPGSARSKFRLGGISPVFQREHGFEEARRHPRQRRGARGWS